MNIQKGSAPILLIVLGLAVAGAGIFYYSTTNKLHFFDDTVLRTIDEREFGVHKQDAEPSTEIIDLPFSSILKFDGRIYDLALDKYARVKGTTNYDPEKYFPIFDYGILLNNGSFFDLDSKELMKISDFTGELDSVIGVYPHGTEYVAVLFGDNKKYIFADSYYWKEHKIIVFKRDGTINEVMSYKRERASDATDREPRDGVGSVFWKDKKLYVELLDIHKIPSYYEIDIDASIGHVSPFRKTYSDPATNRDHTGLGNNEIIEFCKDNKYCINTFAIYTADIDLCISHVPETAGPGGYGAARCFVEYAKENDDITACDFIESETHKKTCLSHFHKNQDMQDSVVEGTTELENIAFEEVRRLIQDNVITQHQQCNEMYANEGDGTYDHCISQLTLKIGKSKLENSGVGKYEFCGTTLTVQKVRFEDVSDLAQTISNMANSEPGSGFCKKLTSAYPDGTLAIGIDNFILEDPEGLKFKRVRLYDTLNESDVFSPNSGVVLSLKLATREISYTPLSMGRTGFIQNVVLGSY